MAMRFVKPKIDRYVQLYSEYAKHEGPLYGSVISVIITNGGTGYTSAPIVSFPNSIGLRATATWNGLNGAINTVTITNPGYRYIAVPTIALSGGGPRPAGGSHGILTAVMNLAKKGSLSGI